MKTNPQTYIKKLKMKGYKSIKDLEVTLNPGLNILIGKNGSGKSNFFEFIEGVVDRKVLSDREYSFETELSVLVSKKEEFEEINGFWRMELSSGISKIEGDEIFVVRKAFEEINFGLKYNDEWPTSLIDDVKFLPTNIEKFKLIYENFSYCKVDFGLRMAFENLNSQLSISIKKSESHEKDTGFSDGFTELQLKSKRLPHSFLQILTEKGVFIGGRFAQKSLSFEEVKKELKINNEFKELLSFYSPIEDMKVVNITGPHFDYGNDKIDFLLNFKIGGQWMQWDYLSDGTKRIFDIIFTVFTAKNDIVLIEEPELGLHPNQLHKLLNFLQEQAKTKQIIISTHAPEVLNILKKEDLDRIILSEYDKEEGTKMRHLSQKEQKHIHSYLDDEVLYLSDFWVRSGFEPERIL